MITELISATGWIFWIGVIALLAVELLIAAFNEDDDSPTVFGIFLLVGAALFVVLFTDAFEGFNPVWAAIIALAYIAVGVVWAFYKWWAYVTKERDRLRGTYQQVDKTRPGNETWESYVRHQRPSASNQKGRIVNWMTLWPFSVLWWLLTWPRRFFVWLYNRLSTVFDRITDRIFNS